MISPTPKSNSIKIWWQAVRPRTLPLALAGILLGSLLAAAEGKVNWVIAGLSLLTAVLLQILSNLANDYGDAVHGADTTGRVGPTRAVQSGLISGEQMRQALMVVMLLTMCAGTFLLILAVYQNPRSFAFFITVGGCAIAAAILYTNGERPYGYLGLGDLFVLIFFGWAAVLGSYYLQTQVVHGLLWLPASSCGLLSVGVLNVNNLRDLESDKRAGKMSIPVRLGAHNARLYHVALLLFAFIFACIYVTLTFTHIGQWLFLLTTPLLVRNGLGVYRAQTPAELIPYLKQTVQLTLIFCLALGVGQLL